MIHRLSKENIRELRALNDLFGDEFDEKSTYCHNPPSDSYLNQLLVNEDFIGLVFRAEGTVVGGLVAYVLRKFEQERSEIYIYDLAVSKPFRRKGVATSLIRELRGIAKMVGAWVVFVQADYEDAPAIALYESLGLKEEVLHYDISVD